MAEVKWIKIVTDIFDDEKILMIESMPEADSLIVIWFKLLCLAGKQNNSGVLMLGRMPYTDEMFSTIFRRPINTVRLALQTFEGFGMIEIINNTVTIPNWGKHQNIEGMDKIREQNKLRKQKQRERQKLLPGASCDGHVTVTGRHATDKDKERDLEKESEGEGNISSPTPSPKNPPRHKYGMYNNVLLSDEDMEKLQAEFPHDYTDRIERLSEYIASTGKSYKSHLATIRAWSRKDKATTKKQETSSNPFLDMLKNGEV